MKKIQQKPVSFEVGIFSERTIDIFGAKPGVCMTIRSLNETINIFAVETCSNKFKDKKLGVSCSLRHMNVLGSLPLVLIRGCIHKNKSCTT